MKSISKHIVFFILLVGISGILSCVNNTDLYGVWQSVRIDNRAAFFTNVYPTAEKGEIELTLDKDTRFIWINKKESGKIVGTFSSSGDSIIFKSDSNNEIIETKFRKTNTNLIIMTPDGFEFDFVRKK